MYLDNILCQRCGDKFQAIKSIQSNGLSEIEIKCNTNTLSFGKQRLIIPLNQKGIIQHIYLSLLIDEKPQHRAQDQDGHMERSGPGLPGSELQK